MSAGAPQAEGWAPPPCTPIMGASTPTPAGAGTLITYPQPLHPHPPAPTLGLGTPPAPRLPPCPPAPRGAAPPPLTAMAMAMSASVTVSMGEEMRGVFRVILRVSAEVRSWGGAETLLPPGHPPGGVGGPPRLPTPPCWGHPSWDPPQPCQAPAHPHTGGPMGVPGDPPPMVELVGGAAPPPHPQKPSMAPGHILPPSPRGAAWGDNDITHGGGTGTSRGGVHGDIPPRGHRVPGEVGGAGLTTSSAVKSMKPGRMRKSLRRG